MGESRGPDVRRIGALARGRQYKEALTADSKKIGTLTGVAPREGHAVRRSGAVQVPHRTDASRRSAAHAALHCTYNGKPTEACAVFIAAITSAPHLQSERDPPPASSRARGQAGSREAWVKTSLAPGSSVTDYHPAECPVSRALGLHLVGYGCPTCIFTRSAPRYRVGDRVR